MPLTKISTNSVKDDAVTVDKMASNSVGSSQIINTGVSTDDIASQAVNADKIANNTITTLKIGDNQITQAKINVPLSNRNLIVNGAMNVAQRGTTSTSTGHQTVDRFALLTTGVDEAPTQEQAAVTSGGAYDAGFRKCFKITNGNQTSGADAPDHILARYKIEAQDIANSGWNYTSTSSSITLSFWIKSSVAQNFYFNLIAGDGTPQNYAYETGSLSANTWTKVTKTIPGHANLTFNNDTGTGLQIDWWAYAGTNVTNSNVNLNQWFAYTSTNRMPIHATTWYTTNDATLEITGIQLEVGSVATNFEHRSFSEELARCQRYCYVIPYGGSSDSSGGNEEYIQGSNVMIFDTVSFTKACATIMFPQTMIGVPSYTGSATALKARLNNSSANFNANTFAIFNNRAAAGNVNAICLATPANTITSVGSSPTSGFLEFNAAGGFMKFESEL